MRQTYSGLDCKKIRCNTYKKESSSMLRARIIFYSLFLCSSFESFAVDPVAQEPLNNQSLVQKIIQVPGVVRDFLNDWTLENLGAENCRPETEEFIRDHLRALGVSWADTITIRRVSKTGIYGCGIGPVNAFVSILWFKKYLYVIEDWFMTLSEDEKRALITHEATHISEHHLLIQRVVGLSCVSALWVARMYALEKHFGPQSLLLFIGADITVLFGLPMLSRYLEIRADNAAIQVSPNGALKLMNQFDQLEKELEREKPQWKLLVWRRMLRRFLRRPFLSHPRPEKRIANVRKVAKARNLQLDEE